MTAPMRTSSASAAHREQRVAINAPIYVADPWQDWKRHYAQLRHNRMVQLWDGARPVVLTICGQLAEAGTDVRYATDCESCKRIHAAEQAAVLEMRRPLRKQQEEAA